MKRILALLLALIPGLAHAELADKLVNYQVRVGNDSITLNDLSFKYLQDIFGVVDGVLHGTGTQIMGAMFGVFNSAVLTLGFIVMSYVFMVSTINTAHEGEILGKKWSSIWIPLRMVGATALIVPKASGYCTIQIFIMATVVQGIIAANGVAGAALGYIARGGVLIQSSPPPDSKMVQSAGDILKSLVCMNGVYNVVQNLANDAQTNPPARFVPTAYNPSANITPRIDFPSNDASYNGSSFGGMCGNVTWQSKSAADSTGANADMRGLAIQQVVMDLQPFSQQLADQMVPPPGGTNGSSSLNQVTSANNLALLFAAADYKGIMLPFYNEKRTETQALALKTIKDKAKQGWIMLGSLYFALAQLNENVNGDDSNTPDTNYTQVSPTGSAWQMIKKTPYGTSFFCTENCGANVLTSDKPSSGLTESDNVIDNYIYSSYTANMGAGGTYKAGKGKFATDAGGTGSKIIALVVGPMYGIIHNFAALADAENQNTDPIVAVSGLGSSIINLVTQLWFGIAGSILAIALAVSLVPCVNPGGFGMLSFLAWFVPMFSVILMALFVSGATMAFYVPLIPFILFTFAALGWFAAVIESMIAAPLVALGIAAPEGHEIFGKAEPAIMLLANVFLRPTLMVFGFFAGAILSHVGLWLLNKGFAASWGWVILHNIGNLGIAVIWGLVAGLVIYMSLVMAIINQTFGLIHQLPDELMRWLGGGMRALGGSPGEALSGVKGEFGSAMQTTGKQAQKAGQASLAYRDKKAKEEEGSATFESNGPKSGGGGAAPGSGGGAPK